MDIVETVDEHCEHKDCVYRMRLDAYGREFCNYCVMEYQLRGCPISKCTRYKAGTRTVAMTRTGLLLVLREVDECEHSFR